MGVLEVGLCTVGCELHGVNFTVLDLHESGFAFCNHGQATRLNQQLHTTSTDRYFVLEGGQADFKRELHHISSSIAAATTTSYMRAAEGAQPPKAPAGKKQGGSGKGQRRQ